MTILLFIALFTKHLIVDFPLQGPYQYLNKGTYGHPGGILHAALHYFGSMLVLLPILGLNHFGLLSAVCVGEMILHYHIDWAKMNLNSKMEWQCNTSEKFWWLLGLDQYLHYLTYALMVWLLV